MFLLLHRSNKIVICQKKLNLLTACLPPPICKNFNIHLRKENINENYVKFDFRMGAVLLIFSFF